MMIKAGVEEENETYETFHETVATALDFLSQDEDGFVLMAEGAHIDHGGHNNDIDYMVEELLAFDQGVEAALEWAKGRTDTVIIVTADHETGDLHLRDGITKYNYRDMETANGFEYETEEEFCLLLNTILQNPEWRQMASEQSTHIAKNYDKATFAEKIENVYEAITA